MKKYTGIIVIVVVLAVAAGFFVLGSAGSGSGPGPGGNDLSLESQLNSIPVKTMPAVSGTLEDYIRISGDVKAASSIAIYPDVAGTLSAVQVSTGEYVQAGSTVAEVDPSRPGAAYSISPVDTPIAGTVTEIFAEIGETVSTSVPILEIGRLDTLEVKTRVSERYVNRIEVGQTAWIETDALSGERIKARVSSVSPVVDSTTRTMEISLAITGSQAGLKAGMLADVTLVLNRLEKTIKVPSSAVTERSGGSYIFVVSGSSVNMQQVETGLTIDNITQITSGLSANDEIVYSGMSMLSNGSAVRVVSEDAGLPAAGNVEDSDA